MASVDATSPGSLQEGTAIYILKRIGLPTTISPQKKINPSFMGVFSGSGKNITGITVKIVKNNSDFYERLSKQEPRGLNRVSQDYFPAKTINRVFMGVFSVQGTDVWSEYHWDPNKGREK